MHQYAVTWLDGDSVQSGRLETYQDRFELRGRTSDTIVPFADVAAARIVRGPADRLLGLPVLEVATGDNTLRIASLEGAGVLHELSAIVEARRLKIPA